MRLSPNMATTVLAGTTPAPPAAATASEKEPSVAEPLASVTVIAKPELVPAAVGVPVIAPVVLPNDRPAGSEPASVKLRAPEPPETVGVNA